MYTLPCSFKLKKVSDKPTVGTVVIAAIGVNLLIEEVRSWEGARGREIWFWVFFFKKRKPLGFRATAIREW